MQLVGLLQGARGLDCRRQLFLDFRQVLADFLDALFDFAFVGAGAYHIEELFYHVEKLFCQKNLLLGVAVQKVFAQQLLLRLDFVALFAQLVVLVLLFGAFDFRVADKKLLDLVPPGAEFLFGLEKPQHDVFELDGSRHLVAHFREELFDEFGRRFFQLLFNRGRVFLELDQNVAFVQKVELVDAERQIHGVVRLFLEVDDDPCGRLVDIFYNAQAPALVHAARSDAKLFDFFALCRKFRTLFYNRF